MIDRFTAFVKTHQLLPPGGKTLLAVSGGIDSMALWRLYELANFDYSVIHCNFQLRGADSLADERLVTEHAKELGTRLFVKKFDTRGYARLSGVSVEMAARELRYAWFEEIRAAEKFTFIATAHHQDDLIETFFINLVRKTGIKGLTGFREKSGFLIRPMLFTNRQEIETWADANQVKYREDATNSEVLFQRNFIRHEIIPRLETLNSAFRQNLAETMANLRQVEDFYQTEADRQINKITDHEAENPELFISQLLKLAHPRQVLFEWMSRYGFNPSAAESLYDNLLAEPGRQYFSKTHRLVTGRNKLIITGLPDNVNPLFYIEKNDLEIREPLHLEIESRSPKGFEIIRDPYTACLDAGELDFPLIIRKWKPGEYFQPLGMSGFKKISDFFVDEKLSLPEKEETWILYSGDKVVWIIGRRIDNRFRITPETKEILMIRMIR